MLVVLLCVALPQVNNALYSKQTRSKLNVDSAPQFLAFTSSAIVPSIFKMILVAAIAIAIIWAITRTCDFWGFLFLRTQKSKIVLIAQVQSISRKNWSGVALFTCKYFYQISGDCKALVFNSCFISRADKKQNNTFSLSHIWLILRCWGNSSILCQQNSDAL